MTKDEVLSHIAEILWWDSDTEEWNHDKEWDCPEFLGMIAGLLIDNGLQPQGTRCLHGLFFTGAGACPQCETQGSK